MTPYVWGKLFGAILVLTIGVLLLFKGKKYMKEQSGRTKAILCFLIGSVLTGYQSFSITMLLVNTKGIPGADAWVADTRRGFIDGCVKKHDLDTESCTCLQQALEQRVTRKELDEMVDNGFTDKWQIARQEAIDVCGLNDD